MIVPLLCFFFLTFLEQAFSATFVFDPLDDQLPLIAQQTFRSAEGAALVYSTSELPPWLLFNSATRTFSGTPGSGDLGNPLVTVTATASNSSASSAVTLCVSSFAPPKLSISLQDQFTPSNRAISSVFTVSPGSALATSAPGLRIPSGPWSFSIGFEGGTYNSTDDLFYAVRLANGEQIPYWMVFDPDDITLDGWVPREVGLLGPEAFSVVLISSDQEGYSAESTPFTITIANHELSTVVSELPTINVTAGSTFTTSLLSPSDFMGFLVDGDILQPSNISTLTIDTSGYDWLSYDELSRTLSGTPATNLNNSRFRLPVVLTTTFNQSLPTSVSIQLVASYFALPEFPALHLSPGSSFELILDQFYSNSTAGRDGDADISAPNFIRLGTGGDSIFGTIPDDSTADHITCVFTAYSQITHSTSHANLIIFNTARQLSADAHQKLVLGLGITFGLLGGLSSCARVRVAWTRQERRYYGLDTSSSRLSSLLYRGDSPRGLRSRVPERSHSYNGGSDASALMSKREFVSRVRQTVRQVSNKYTRSRPQPSPRPVIGRPILLQPSMAIDLNGPRSYPASTPNPFDDVHSIRASTFMTGSPSTSTAEHSIPRRRADFAPPRSMAQVHFEDGHLVRQPSNATMSSDRLSRHTSIRSARSTSYLSHENQPDPPEGPLTRPRLVPFTSSTRVPVPRVPSMVGNPSSGGPVPVLNIAKSRITSQRAKIFNGKNGGLKADAGDALRKSNSGDDLSMGLHYVRSLGAESPSSGEENAKANTTKEVTRYVVRAGEKFHIRLQLAVTATKLEVRQMSGLDLPKFMDVDVSGAKGMVEFTGIALSRDLGEVTIGVYAEKECVSKIILEVIPRR
ncbi:hypothetical protein FA15DRAFT_684616 [Coprinopsis marcescibilis]|uniref:Dystroglycan-type cadherin-like domain-containing protein n=1 Tax=Coprinopsis marcescibilis TaxID=230819 RepID=A0A5C3LM19_COPMA|nr:hypothetical protein FA15DRAFT_684616 [Coprinopsis marcescibilis]